MTYSSRVSRKKEGAVGGEAEVDAVTEDPGSLDLSSLYSLLQKTLQTQEREAFKQEKRWRSVQLQLNNFHDELEWERRRGDGAGRQQRLQPCRRQHHSPQSRQPDHHHQHRQPCRQQQHRPQYPGDVPVPKLADGDDVEQYLTTFERLATAYRWPPAVWAVFLVPYLMGRARSAYVAMDPYDAMDYFKVKEAILAKYAINAEVYCQRFCDPNIERGGTPREFNNQLKDLFHKWIKPAGKMVEDIKEILILEQFLHFVNRGAGVGQGAQPANRTPSCRAGRDFSGCPPWTKGLPLSRLQQTCGDG